jgi:hypothetical protein
MCGDRPFERCVTLTRDGRTASLLGVLVALVALARLFSPASAQPPNAPLFRVVQGGKWGYVERSGKLVISPRFDAAGAFSEGLAPVLSDGKTAYADASGKIVLVPEFDPAGGQLHRRFANGRAAVKKDGLFGFIDRSGKLAVPARFTWADDFSEGLAATCEPGKCGYVDADGKTVLAPGVEGGNPFRSGVAGVNAGMGMVVGTFYVYSLSTGRLPGEYELVGNFSEGLMPVRYEGKWGFIDGRGVPRIGASHDWAGDFAEGLAPVRPTDGEPCGYVDREGKLAIPARYRSCGPFSSGRARVDLAREAHDAEHVAFIDRTGRVVIDSAKLDPPFDRAEDFVDGLAAVAVGGEPQHAGAGGPQLGYIDPDGRYVWKPSN